MERDFAVITKNEKETIDLGKQIASSLKSGDVISLYGDLGSGKTRLVKGICEGLGINNVVNSPTFIIVNEYSSEKFGNVYHFDLYRLKSEDEILAMGFEDYMNSRGIVLIEWPRHAERLLPADSIKIHISHSVENENERWIKIEGIEK
ncbi:MAG TPA: tRNA (adenosine(37)-N6)-threonylcarbamoyltransferase complex ATPase subunit type 1 TsaE [Ignavibacteria bacterium]|nr:tRNA (adenosine(37)-N6)-threonylcarbamoyltransferase complex ATPase subunit type 1 TsaE [Ignavibacteria bacterium]HAX49393.1 tRNA (adenosine(37)-N6)-threonylcarbamoyltransferase complex ATPase subunit type 1 TsaE [Bacteroidota bacterium]HRE11318.1 tRNA (adenosine(37)-N6)-threonylcarbamoyltransferase complex ATPase subunit type 1 TsaE [Ignavibacteria bacterium]HRF65662.1 tRNA (adenosine(37)-N6)-threonylcarbamoyltransferase complex ATPase subunit type 1 TsaE [Ignavibacteria bacterium]HRJ03306.